MAKVSGLGATVIVDDAGGVARTISNDVNDLQFATPRAVQDTTGVDKYAMERLLLLADYSVTLKGTFNSGDTNMSHDVFKTVPLSTSPARTTKIQPIAGATPYLSCETVYTDYALNRGNNGELTWSAPGALSDGTAPTWS